MVLLCYISSSKFVVLFSYSFFFLLLSGGCLVEHIQLASHSHPERSYRIRAIATSLSTGIFPGRCYQILARETMREELQMILQGIGRKIMEKNMNALGCD